MAQIQHVYVGIMGIKEFGHWYNVAFPLQLLTVVHPQNQQIPLCKALPQPLDQVSSTAVN